MTAHEPALADDPRDDAFLDALLGLACWTRRLESVLIDEPVARAAAAPGDLGVASALGGPAPDDAVLDAVLGLVSLRTTIDLVLAALPAEGDAAPASADPPAWSREILR